MDPMQGLFKVGHGIAKSPIIWAKFLAARSDLGLYKFRIIQRWWNNGNTVEEVEDIFKE